MRKFEEIQSHFTSDEVSFPLPDKKYANRRFLHTSVTKCAKMYMLVTTTQKKTPKNQKTQTKSCQVAGPYTIQAKLLQKVSKL